MCVALKNAGFGRDGMRDKTCLCRLGSLGSLGLGGLGYLQGLSNLGLENLGLDHHVWRGGGKWLSVARI